MGSMQIMCLFFYRNIVGVPICQYLLIVRTLFPNLSSITTFAATPLVLIPFVRNQTIAGRMGGHGRSRGWRGQGCRGRWGLVVVQVCVGGGCGQEGDGASKPASKEAMYISYVCVHVCIYIYIHKHIYIYIYTYTHTHTHIHIHIHIHIQIHVLYTHTMLL